MTKVLLRLIVLVGLLVPWAGTAQAGGWIQECVDCPKYAVSLTDRSLRLDAAGHPHMAYGGDHLYYAWHDGTTWHRETADSAPAVGARATLGLDALNRPHIAYYDRPQDAIKYAHRDEAGWHVETIATDVRADPPYISLAVDSQGEVHLAFDGTAWIDGYGLHYARRGPADWTIEYVGNPGLELRGLSLALDGNDVPQIAFIVEEGSKLWHAWREDDGWDYYAADTGLGRPYAVSLALDSQGQAKVALDGGTALWYGWRLGAVWLFETAVPTGADSVSLALDDNGQPWVSHHDRGTGELLVSHKEGTTWQVEVALAAESSDLPTVADTSLALDGHGRPRVVTNRRGSLQYVQKDGGAWVSEVVEHTAAVGRYSDLAVDSEGYVHVAYYDYTGARFKYAQQHATGWHLQTLPCDIERNTFGPVSLALDGNDRPHIVYTEYDVASGTYQVRYLTWDGQDWLAETVADDWAWSVSLALSEGGAPHIGFCVPHPDLDVRYAHREPGGWQVDQVHTRMAGQGYVSLAVDALDVPHIAYSFYDYGPLEGDRGIVYGTLGASGWVTETVYALGGGDVSLALDGSGAPHIAFTSEGDIKYARRQAGSWELETVDAGQLRVSLALDEVGTPSIAYFQRGANYDQLLRFARRVGPEWETSSIHTNSGWEATSSSLGLDAAGRAAISFHDRDNEDLKVAFYLETDRAIYLPLVTR